MNYTVPCDRTGRYMVCFSLTRSFRPRRLFYLTQINGPLVRYYVRPLLVTPAARKQTSRTAAAKQLPENLSYPTIFIFCVWHSS